MNPAKKVKSLTMKMLFLERCLVRPLPQQTPDEMLVYALNRFVGVLACSDTDALFYFRQIAANIHDRSDKRWGALRKLRQRWFTDLARFIEFEKLKDFEGHPTPGITRVWEDILREEYGPTLDTGTPTTVATALFSPQPTCAQAGGVPPYSEYENAHLTPSVEIDGLSPDRSGLKSRCRSQSVVSTLNNAFDSEAALPIMSDEVDAFPLRRGRGCKRSFDSLSIQSDEPSSSSSTSDKGLEDAGECLEDLSWLEF
jgi:hypothetical protein